MKHRTITYNPFKFKKHKANLKTSKQVQIQITNKINSSVVKSKKFWKIKKIHKIHKKYFLRWLRNHLKFSYARLIKNRKMLNLVRRIDRVRTKFRTNFSLCLIPLKKVQKFKDLENRLSTYYILLKYEMRTSNYLINEFRILKKRYINLINLCNLASMYALYLCDLKTLRDLHNKTVTTLLKNNQLKKNQIQKIKFYNKVILILLMNPVWKKRKHIICKIPSWKKKNRFTKS